jgi:hypothetical protein
MIKKLSILFQEVFFLALWRQKEGHIRRKKKIKNDVIVQKRGNFAREKSHRKIKKPLTYYYIRSFSSLMLFNIRAYFYSFLR